MGRWSMKKKILLVDDDQLFLRVTARGIEMAGPEYQVIAEQDGQRAIEYLKSEKVELLITDLVMPSMSGCDLVMYMLNNKIIMPVIVLSGYVIEKEWPLSHLGGTCIYLSKPIRAKTLVSTIRKCLDRMAAGQDNSVSLITILQLFALEQRTSTLRICENNKTGTVVFSRGKPTDIQVDDVKGEKALADMLSWKDLSIEVVATRNKK
jgi:Response regulator containing CheY-like receiver, AAA-type ATPase, and DNA-binding domains